MRREQQQQQQQQFQQVITTTSLQEIKRSEEITLEKAEQETLEALAARTGQIRRINGLDLGSEPVSPNSFVDAGVSAQLGPYLHNWKPQTRRTVTKRHVLVGRDKWG